MSNKTLKTAGLGLLLYAFAASAGAEQNAPYGVFAPPSTNVPVAVMTADNKCLTSELKLIGMPTTGEKPEVVLRKLWEKVVSGNTVEAIISKWPHAYNEAVKDALDTLKPTLEGAAESNVFVTGDKPNIIIVNQAATIGGAHYTAPMIVKLTNACAAPGSPS
ncbi:MAG TPA: hypothetical protein VIF12_01175 [Micavibrio sp.]|jgi:hypothetical protein